MRFRPFRSVDASFFANAPRLITSQAVIAVPVSPTKDRG
jgi:hypothetical protein